MSLFETGDKLFLGGNVGTAKKAGGGSTTRSTVESMPLGGLIADVLGLGATDEEVAAQKRKAESVQTFKDYRNQYQGMEQAALENQLQAMGPWREFANEMTGGRVPKESQANTNSPVYQGIRDTDYLKGLSGDDAAYSEGRVLELMASGMSEEDAKKRAGVEVPRMAQLRKGGSVDAEAKRQAREESY